VRAALLMHAVRHARWAETDASAGGRHFALGRSASYVVFDSLFPFVTNLLCNHCTIVFFFLLIFDFSISKLFNNHQQK
jgi:hypothetical protein